MCVVLICVLIDVCEWSFVLIISRYSGHGNSIFLLCMQRVVLVCYIVITKVLYLNYVRYNGEVEVLEQYSMDQGNKYSVRLVKNWQTDIGLCVDWYVLLEFGQANRA